MSEDNTYYCDLQQFHFYYLIFGTEKKQVEKSHVGIFSNHTSLTERDEVSCEPGYFLCSGTECCPMECMGGGMCDTNHCRRPDYYCCEDGIGGSCPIGHICCMKKCCEIGQTCVNNQCVEKWTPTAVAPIPKPTSTCLTAADIKTTNYKDVATNADGNTPVYVNNNGIMTKKTLNDIRTENNGIFNVDGNLYNADHVFEAQIITNYLNSLEEEVRQKLCNGIMSNLDELKNIINNVNNLRFLSQENNNAKGVIFADKTMRKTAMYRDAVKDYLTMKDVYDAFSETRKSVINFMRKILKYADEFSIVHKRSINATYFEISFSDFSRSEYEDFTNKTLPPDEPLPNSSSTLQLSYLHLPFSVTL
ncbi:9140_t:CDS:2, partial [Gigaspora margarita]